MGLSETSATEIIAVNGRRGWWRHYSSDDGFSLHSVESWIDAIRLGEGSKSKLPEGVIKLEEKQGEEKVEEPEEENVEEKEVPHDEL